MSNFQTMDEEELDYVLAVIHASISNSENYLHHEVTEAALYAIRRPILPPEEQPKKKRAYEFHARRIISATEKLKPNEFR